MDIEKRRWIKIAKDLAEYATSDCWDYGEAVNLLLSLGLHDDEIAILLDEDDEDEEDEEDDTFNNRVEMFFSKG